MPNSYFSFKQFTVQQDKCAMKVCTDACLFGAFIARGQWLQGNRVLDIGTGTGLLSLLLAQKHDHAEIDAVEIDDTAAVQASENFAASPWADRLNIYRQPIQQFTERGAGYDFIISNPPFFEGDLKSNTANRNLALHSEGLKLEELVGCINRLLKNNGSFAVLLPYHRLDFFEKLAGNQGFFLAEKLLVQQTPSHPFFRGILVFGKTVVQTLQHQITIKTTEGKYSPEFTELLKDYYLHL
ncbi:tRNA1(Val) (adenine(37)-N6)-methyltransferase [Foetidibacter luteolus]|uniref:tRNA1(Val) (adenine(37)-N6)-methyltransferase n=1 Tax=Foetidibacter luteolus TaxID=2608880 RepID=UPI00129ADF0F|nr:methyltransferase [Foetidibacter luteolus]